MIQKVALGLHCGGVAFSGEWGYASIVVIIMFLANNSRPYSSYAVHIFTHFPKSSHKASRKIIIYYLQVKKDKGLIISPIKTLQVDCHVDADFSRLWDMKHEQDTTCVKSHTGNIILFMSPSVDSKATNPDNSKYHDILVYCLSTAMCELIGVRKLLEKVYSVFLKYS